MPATSRRRHPALLLAGLLVVFAGLAAAPANAGLQLANGGDLGGLSLDGVILPDATE